VRAAAFFFAVVAGMGNERIVPVFHRWSKKKSWARARTKRGQVSTFNICIDDCSVIRE
jgi:hypothetical protein